MLLRREFGERDVAALRSRANSVPRLKIDFIGPSARTNVDS
jgi:hypothetical protein